MTSRDRVLASFAHEEPDRVPAWCGASAGFWQKARGALDLDDEGLRVYLEDDFRRVHARYVGPDLIPADGAESRTIFGIDRRGLGYGQPTSHPLAEASLRDVEAYPWPDPQWYDVSGIAEDANRHGGRYAILGGAWSPFWHDAIDLVGMENLYVRMYDDPPFVDSVFGRLVDFYAALNERILDAAASAIDIFFIGNDFGSQTGPLLSEAMFRRYILPHLDRLVRMGHDYGLRVMMHCCGGFAELIPAMVEIGLDGVHAIQPCCRGMEPRRLKAEFGDKILFNGAIDSQHVLIDGTPGTVRRKVREVLAVMMPGGGYVAGASHDSILEETPLENVLAMFETVREFGVYGPPRAG